MIDIAYEQDCDGEHSPVGRFIFIFISWLVIWFQP